MTILHEPWQFIDTATEQLPSERRTSEYPEANPVVTSLDTGITLATLGLSRPKNRRIFPLLPTREQIGGR
jgi:hypothetical protein